MDGMSQCRVPNTFPCEHRKKQRQRGLHVPSLRPTFTQMCSFLSVLDTTGGTCQLPLIPRERYKDIYFGFSLFPLPLLPKDEQGLVGRRAGGDGKWMHPKLSLSGQWTLSTRLSDATFRWPWSLTR